MRKKLKDKWIKALRSGKYKQTYGTLRGKVGFCCLGVLCDIRNPKGWSVPKRNGHNQVYYISKENNCIGMLSSKILKAIQMSQDQMEKLIKLNDSRKHNFKTIAKYIEKNL